MTLASDNAGLLRELEELLLQPIVRASAEQLSDLLADDFLEFASNGRVYDKPGIIVGLKEEQLQGGYIRSSLHDFEVRALGDGLALVTYRAVRQGARESLRSSIWKYAGGRWQLLFHQGTLVPAQ
jgi:hypothetical protein